MVHVQYVSLNVLFEPFISLNLFLYLVKMNIWNCFQVNFIARVVNKTRWFDFHWIARLTYITFEIERYGNFIVTVVTIEFASRESPMYLYCSWTKKRVVIPRSSLWSEYSLQSTQIKSKCCLCAPLLLNRCFQHIFDERCSFQYSNYHD